MEVLKNIAKNILIFLLITILYVLFFPALLNIGILKGFTPEVAYEGIGILRWSLVAQEPSFIFAGIVLYFVTLVALWTAISGSDKKNVGTEHGSAKFMTDKEFDALVPNYMFRKDEYAYPRSDDSSTEMEYLKESNKDIFEDIDFEEVEVYE